jgi:hypothetical protein
VFHIALLCFALLCLMLLYVALLFSCSPVATMLRREQTDLAHVTVPQRSQRMRPGTGEEISGTCKVMLCYAMLCYAVLYYAMLCCAIPMLSNVTSYTVL